MNSTEKEVKFFISDKDNYISRLLNAGAVLTVPRVQEINLRYDSANGEFRKSRRVLRLRKDHNVHLTYKDAPQANEAVSARREIELDVNDFEAARALLEALGYVVTFVYEKYRATYTLGNCLITLDEIPLGVFSEIEGPDERSIAENAKILKLDWEKRVLESYLGLFSIWKEHSGSKIQNLTFEDFSGSKIDNKDLTIKPADA